MPEIARLETTAQLDELIKTSRSRPVWIFKHSLVCPVSSRAWEEFRGFAADRQESGGDSGAAWAVIEIQNARPVSAAVAERTGVRHESPQALLLRGGEVAWHESHWNITARSLAAAGEAA